MQVSEPPRFMTGVGPEAVESPAPHFERVYRGIDAEVYRRVPFKAAQLQVTEKASPKLHRGFRQEIAPLAACGPETLRCGAVGYTSPSQFSRQFRRLFGLTPAAETKRMRKSFAIPPVFPDAEYVSSH